MTFGADLEVSKDYFELVSACLFRVLAVPASMALLGHRGL